MAAERVVRQRHVRDVQDQRPLSGGLRVASSSTLASSAIAGVLIRKPERFLSVAGRGPAGEARRLQHGVHLVSPGGFGDEGAAAVEGAPQDQRVHASEIAAASAASVPPSLRPTSARAGAPLRARSSFAARTMSPRQVATRSESRSSPVESPVPSKSNLSTGKPAAAKVSARWRNGRWARTMSSPMGLQRTPPSDAGARRLADETSRTAAGHPSRSRSEPSRRRCAHPIHILLSASPGPSLQRLWPSLGQNAAGRSEPRAS